MNKLHISMDTHLFEHIVFRQVMTTFPLILKERDMSELIGISWLERRFRKVTRDKDEQSYVCKQCLPDTILR